MNNKNLAILAVIALLVAVGGYFFPKTGLVGAAAPSSVGATFLTAKVATIEWSLAGPTATTTSILNSDATDREIESVKVVCSGMGTSLTPLTGVGLITLQLKAATTSTSVPSIISNTNTLLTSAVISTSTADFYLSTSSPGLAGTGGNDYVRVWGTGSYLSFSTNATNTAQCLVGVSYLSL